jgi:hypothetical protein
MGSYVNKHLIKDEVCAYETKLHWVIFFTKSMLTLTFMPGSKRWLSEFVITNRRIVIKEGFIARRTFEMNLSKIETVNVDQTVLGASSISVSITIIPAPAEQETFHNIARPMAFRQAFQELC